MRLTSLLRGLVWWLAWVGVLPGSLSAAGEAAVTDFIRVEEDAAAARLQTAVTRYRKEGVTVDLIGAIHVADKAYYEALNRRFEGYDAMLFEMIGGREQDRAGGAAAAEGRADGAAEEEPENMAGLHQVYAMVSRFMGLTDQMANIDYTPKNFVHADLSLEEFRRLQEEKGESVIGFALEAGRKAEKEGAVAQPDIEGLVRAVMSGNANSLKLQIVHTLGQGDDQIAAFAGGSVIIGDRNAKCLEVLERQVKGGKRKLGIFYGAAHFPDMEKRLTESGYRRVSQEWLTAWDIPKAKPAVREKPAEEADEAA